MRLDSLDIRKSSGSVTGAAFVGWDGDYSFNADGARIPVESLKTATVPAGAAVGPAAVQRHRRGHLRRAALRRQAARRRSLRRRRGHRSAERPAVAAGRTAHARDGSRVSAPGRLRLGPHRADAGDGCRADRPLRRHVARSVRPILRAAALAVHERRRRRHHPRRRRARERRSPGRRDRTSRASTSSCSTTASTTRGPIDLSLDQHVLKVGQLR